jgi:hypothetical protein
MEIGIIGTKLEGINQNAKVGGLEMILFLHLFILSNFSTTNVYF